MTEAVLATHGLCKSFGALTATDDVNIDLRPGEIHAVIGPNGAGKSTLIAQICGGLSPDSGRIDFLGRDVTALPTRARARLGLARTFQISALAMEDTVLQNALLGALGAGGSPWSFLRSALANAAALCVCSKGLKVAGKPILLRNARGGSSGETDKRKGGSNERSA